MSASVPTTHRRVVVEGLEDRCLFTTFTVTTTDDGGMMGTLRRAIQDANSTPGADTIVFDIAPGGPQSIHPNNPLPPIHDTVTIDATTQSGFAGNPIIELTGGGTGPSFGLHLSDGSDGSVIRGLVINNWSRSGIDIMNGSANNVIAGNWIGVDLSGTIARPNVEGGITVEGAGANNRIGGTTAADRNVVSGNQNPGIHLLSTDNTIIQGNYIGTNAAGTLAVPNSGGIFLEQANFTLIGGSTQAAGNVISGNLGDGILLFGASENTIDANYIGSTADGTGAVNNSGAGVAVLDGFGNLIRNNSIFNNGGLGIDLSANPSVADGPTPNDPLDADEGANDLQNFPVITSATTSGGTTTIQGTINSTANTTLVIELFSSVLPDPTGFGEGQTLVATVTVTTDASGNATFTATTATAVPGGQVITGTATNVVRGSTSEFSAAMAVVADTKPPKPEKPPKPPKPPKP